MGVSQDRQQAIQWYRKAVEGGEPQARARLEGLTGGSGLWGILVRHFIWLSGLVKTAE
jgi:TPR repeat protein